MCNLGWIEVGAKVLKLCRVELLRSDTEGVATGMTPQGITDDLDRLLELLPVGVRSALTNAESRQQLLEIVLDLGRPPEARYPGLSLELSPAAISREDLRETVERIGTFGGDNRAGIERTLHRISAIRNRRGDVVGLTCRVGRAVFGTVAMVRDLLDGEQSLLLMGRPGVGKTTALREITRVLADELARRVVVIDTSNEIAGDGDIPHPAIGRARRMQVALPEQQHQVMIEAVENHMPEVIVIDEIGTELEAQAARTIAERGVQLVATAHGNALTNLIKNPTLSDLIGGIQTVTLGDDEARRRRTQKSVLERLAEPTFPVAVEMHSRHRWSVHTDVASTVDLLLRGQSPHTQVRELGDDGVVHLVSTSLLQRSVAPQRSTVATRLPNSEIVGLQNYKQPRPKTKTAPTLYTSARDKGLQVLCCGISPHLLDQISRQHHWPAKSVYELADADVVLSLRQKLGQQPQLRRDARDAGVPILVIKSDTIHQVKRAILRLLEHHQYTHESADDQVKPMSIVTDDALAALEECRLAVERVVLPQRRPVDLLPRSEAVRQMQADLVARYRLQSDVSGPEDYRRLRILPP
ncbi:ATPase AAA [cyanobiont of Ornithocercus magnificus]|nr:ATPase AAA [cyanobiont of Ornithocercus magnificus]